MNTVPSPAWRHIRFCAPGFPLSLGFVDSGFGLSSAHCPAARCRFPGWIELMAADKQYRFFFYVCLYLAPYFTIKLLINAALSWCPLVPSRDLFLSQLELPIRVPTLKTHMGFHELSMYWLNYVT